MSRLHATQLKLVGATSAALLVVGAASAPALAAPTTFNLSCGGGAVVFPTTVDLGSLPTNLVAGQKVKQNIASGTIGLDANAVGLAQAKGWVSVAGDATADGADGATPYTLKIASTPVPAPPAPPAPVTIPVTGSFTLAPTTAGTYKVRVGTTIATIDGTFADGSKDDPLSIGCAGPTDGTQNLGTVKVGKDKTKTSASATSAKGSVKAKAKVKSHYGLKGTGKVSFTLSLGSKKVGSAKGKLSKSGVAKVTFKNVTKAGKYTVKAAFKGDKALKGSKGTGHVKVK